MRPKYNLTVALEDDVYTLLPRVMLALKNAGAPLTELDSLCNECLATISPYDMIQVIKKWVNVE